MIFYKESYSAEKSFEIIKESSGTYFDPVLVEIFFEVKNEILSAFNKFVSVSSDVG